MEANEKPRIARLIAIITQLQTRRIVTAKYLADRHNVSVRTIYRDIRTLEQSGIPIYMEDGKGYSLVDGFQLPPVLFSEEEASALITAEKIILANKDQSLSEAYSRAIEKVKSVLKNGQKDKATLLSERISVGEKQNIEKSSNNLMKIQTAITNFTLLEIEYSSAENKLTNRSIEPFAFYHNNGNWLLIAFCRLRDDFRVFRIDYIQKIIPTNQSFTPHKITLEQFFKKYIKK